MYRVVMTAHGCRRKSLGKHAVRMSLRLKYLALGCDACLRHSQTNDPKFGQLGRQRQPCRPALCSPHGTGGCKDMSRHDNKTMKINDVRRFCLHRVSETRENNTPRYNVIPVGHRLTSPTYRRQGARWSPRGRQTPQCRLRTSRSISCPATW